VNCHLFEGTENNKEKRGGKGKEGGEEEEKCYGNRSASQYFGCPAY